MRMLAIIGHVAKKELRQILRWIDAGHNDALRELRIGVVSLSRRLQHGRCR